RNRPYLLLNFGDLLAELLLDQGVDGRPQPAAEQTLHRPKGRMNVDLGKTDRRFAIPYSAHSFRTQPGLSRSSSKQLAKFLVELNCFGVENLEFRLRTVLLQIGKSLHDLPVLA